MCATCATFRTIHCKDNSLNTRISANGSLDYHQNFMLFLPLTLGFPMPLTCNAFLELIVVWKVITTYHNKIIAVGVKF